MSIVDSLKRLERAGSENGRATKKLHEAACEVAEAIEKVVPAGVKLPRGYRKVERKSNISSSEFLVKEVRCDRDDPDDRYGWKSYYIDGTGGYLHGDFNARIPAQTREGSLLFARDVAEGLLDEIAEFLEQRAGTADAAADGLLANAEEVGRG